MSKSRNDTTKAILEGLIGLFSQNRRWLLFFGTGTSCELDDRLGMSKLTEHLKATMKNAPDWPQIESRLDRGDSLEEALTGVGLSQETKSLIQQISGDYVARIDRELRDDVLLGKRSWVGERLLKTLVHRLPPRKPRLSVLTPNYDMLIEYTCARHDIRYTTGFTGEISRVWSWEKAQDSLNQCHPRGQGAKGVVTMDPLPRVELLKVHGSINRFTHPSVNRQIECDLWSDTPPAGAKRVVAAPGDQKHEGVAGNIMETAAKAREAEDEALAFAMIGYGFNDSHLHGVIYDRVRSQDCPLLVLTLDIADETITELCTLGKKVWILLAQKSAPGGSDRSHTVIYSPCSDYAPIVFRDERLWSCDCFAERILGG